MYAQSPKLFTIIIGVFALVIGILFMQQKVQPAQAGTAVLAPSMKLQATELNVKNLESMKQFYNEIVGLDILKEESGSVTLGYGKREIIRLIATSDLSFAPVTSAGLYHTAIVHSSRGELARAIQRILDRAPQYYSGTSDHIVSEAFYFTDPEGNGLELYFDKDPSTWKWVDDRIQMGSSYIDPNWYIDTYINLPENKEKHMGHVHLKVGNIEEAKKFYVDIMGFNITAERPDALFISVGGYHHHFGMNVWESYGAGKRVETLGLRSVEMALPEQKNVEDLKNRLQQNNVTFEEKNNGVYLNDPWNNLLIIKKD